MLRKKDYIAALANNINILSERETHTPEQLDVLCKNLPVSVMKDPILLARFCVSSGLSVEDSATLVDWILGQSDFLTDIHVCKPVSYTDACNGYELARTNFITIRRVNYIFHECMVMVYNILERDNKMVFAVKKARNEAEKVWGAYEHELYVLTEIHALRTMHDHLRLVNAALSPYIDAVYCTIRDNMIALGYKDIEVKAWCVMTFLMQKVVMHSSIKFFKDFEEATGVDYTKCFADSDLTLMADKFVAMCRLLNIKCVIDADHCWILDGYDVDKCNRFLSAWSKFIKALRDDDLMDAEAIKAINLNPAVKEDYQRVLKEEEERRIEDGIEKLSDKFKVRKVS